MFGVGFTELIVIFVVILIFLGPKELPRVAAYLGKWVRAFNMARHEFDVRVREARNEIDAQQKSITSGDKEEDSASRDT